MRRTLAASLLVGALGLAALVGPTVASAGTADPGLASRAAMVGAAVGTCPAGWGSLDRTAGGSTMSRAPIVEVRAGTHPCFDRVVLDVANGPVGAYRVRYVDQVTGIASGQPINTPGGARLQVTVFDPIGQPTMPSVAGYPTLRSVVNAGSFEGVTSFGVGVRARLPFRVFVVSGPDTRNRLVLDVAHHW